MKKEIKLAMMETAKTFGNLSKARRKKVGAILVRDNRILSIGYNGTPPGWDNECEDFVNGEWVTKPEVLHAEENCLAKIAKSTETSDGSILFVTLSPCMPCAKELFVSGISEVYYDEEYRNTDGIKFLKKCGIKVEKL